MNSKRGKYIVISSPSGGGKTTIIKQLLEKHEDFTYSVSATTRKQREGEVNGSAYWFLTRDEFIEKRDRGDLLEWEEVYGDYYGTPREFAEEAIENGRHVLFDLDVKGALKLKQTLPETLLIFLMPPSMEVLEERFGELSPDLAEEIRSIEDRERLRRLLRLAVQAGSLEAFQEWVGV